MFTFNGMNFNAISCVFEIYVGETLNNRQQVNAPQIVIQQDFFNLISEMANVNQPIKCKLIMVDEIYDEYEKKMKVLENSITVENLAYGK